MFGIRPWRYACVPFVSILALAPAWGQSHEARSGAYTLRASTVASTMLSPESARQHGIERSPTRGVRASSRSSSCPTASGERVNGASST